MTKQKHIQEIKLTCKNHGVKGFRKLALKRTIYIAGKQGLKLSTFIANNLIDSITKKGGFIQDVDCCRQLAEKGLLDTISIRF